MMISNRLKNRMGIVSTAIAAAFVAACSSNPSPKDAPSTSSDGAMTDEAATDEAATDNDATDKAATPASGDGGPAVLEIAIRRVKSGQLDAFKKARTAFLGALKQESGIVADREFEAIVGGFPPKPIDPNRPVFIGMTQYESQAIAMGVSAKTQKPGGFKDLFEAFTATFDFACYAFAIPDQEHDPNPLNLASFPGSNNGDARLELAVRIPNKDDFDTTREAFVQLLGQQSGVGTSRELDAIFTIPTGNEGKWAIGTTVYDNQSSLDEVTNNIGQSPEAGAYFGTFTAPCYFIAKTASNAD